MKQFAVGIQEDVIDSWTVRSKAKDRDVCTQLRISAAAITSVIKLCDNEMLLLT